MIFLKNFAVRPFISSIFLSMLLVFFPYRAQAAYSGTRPGFGFFALVIMWVIGVGVYWLRSKGRWGIVGVWSLFSSFILIALTVPPEWSKKIAALLLVGMALLVSAGVSFLKNFEKKMEKIPKEEKQKTLQDMANWKWWKR
jgi:hypothetical protein